MSDSIASAAGRHGGVDDDAGTHLVDALDDDVLALGEAVRHHRAARGRCARPATRRSSTLPSAPTTSTKAPPWSRCTACCGTVSTCSGWRCSSDTPTSAPSRSVPSGLSKTRAQHDGVGALRDVGARRSRCRPPADSGLPFGSVSRDRRLAARLAAPHPLLVVEDERGGDRELDVDRVEPGQRGERAGLRRRPARRRRRSRGRRCRRRARRSRRRRAAAWRGRACRSAARARPRRGRAGPRRRRARSAPPPGAGRARPCGRARARASARSASAALIEPSISVTAAR